MKKNWINKKLTITIAILVIAYIVVGAIRYFAFNQKNSEDELVSYNRDIRPILSDKCFTCHGPDVKKVKAELRLDQAAFAYAPLKKTKGKFAIVPGHPELSELVTRIESTDPKVMMPLPESHLTPLSPEQIALFKKWIKQGAKYEKHWAFVTPVKAKLPEVEDTKWPSNEIDHFILATMEKKGFSPNKEANKTTLIKRAYIDITGLPPTHEEFIQWTNNNQADWYQLMVKQLLAKPAYGEKMGVLWLDLARYADSYGFQDDNIRTQWPWRDWVINAFNKNMPYDQFLTQQIAGDLLPNANKENILATAFFRNHKYTEEGGVIEEEYRVSYNIDKTKTYGKAVLGVTIECAQCHDHKYVATTPRGAGRGMARVELIIHTRDRKARLVLMSRKDAANVQALLTERLPAHVEGRPTLWLITDAWAHIT